MKCSGTKETNKKTNKLFIVYSTDMKRTWHWNNKQLNINKKSKWEFSVETRYKGLKLDSEQLFQDRDLQRDAKSKIGSICEMTVGWVYYILTIDDLSTVKKTTHEVLGLRKNARFYSKRYR
jgi:hypothetical protein